MTFVKGQPRHPNAGRKKGTPNKATLYRVEPFFLEKGVEPLEELLKLIPMLRSDIQAKVWLEIISYYNAKPKQDAPADAEKSVQVPDWAIDLLLKSAAKDIPGDG